MSHGPLHCMYVSIPHSSRPLILSKGLTTFLRLHGHTEHTRSLSSSGHNGFSLPGLILHMSSSSLSVVLWTNTDWSFWRHSWNRNWDSLVHSWNWHSLVPPVHSPNPDSSLFEFSWRNRRHDSDLTSSRPLFRPTTSSSANLIRSVFYFSEPGVTITFTTLHRFKTDLTLPSRLSWTTTNPLSLFLRISF